MPAAKAARARRAAPVREPLPPGRHLCQDTIIAIGPVAAVLNVAGTLHEAGVISEAWGRYYLEPLLAVPLAVILWHVAAKPAPPPPASAARRALVRAAAALAVLINAAAAAAAVVFIGRRASITWADITASVGYAVVFVMAACGADRRNRARPPAVAGTPSEPAGRSEA